MLGLFVLLALATLLVILLTSWLYAHHAQHPPRRTAAFAIRNNLPCDPGDRGLAFESWRHQVAPGIELDVWDIRPPRDPATNGRVLPAVILVHGWGASRIHMLERIDAYLPHASRIILYDLRGHGESAGSSRLGHDEHIDLLSLIERIDEPQIVIAAHSMGATIAIAAGAQCNTPAARRIRGIIAQGAYTDLTSSLRRRVQLLGMPGFPFTAIASLQLRFKGLRPSPVSDCIADVHCPVLFMHGESDEICSPAELQRAIGSVGHARLEVFAGARHSDLHSSDPDRHNDLIGRFIETTMRAHQPRRHAREVVVAAR